MAARSRGVSEAAQGVSNGGLALLQSQAGTLEAAAHCMQRGWMCILVGGPGSGVSLTHLQTYVLLWAPQVVVIW